MNEQLHTGFALSCTLFFMAVGLTTTPAHAGGQVTLPPPPNMPLTSFGDNCAVDGNVLAVAASQDIGGPTDMGVVFVYLRDVQGTWTQVQKLTPSGMGSGPDDASFGDGLAVSGDVILVGNSPNDDSCTQGTGEVAAYRLSRVTKSWQLQQVLTPSGSQAKNFGYGLDVDRNVAVVGSFFETHTGGVEAGAAYVFEYDVAAQQWVEVKRLQATTASAGHWFGFSAAVDGNWIAIGAPRGGVIFHGGAVYLYERSTWQEIRITPQDTNAFDEFGDALSLDGELVVASSESQDGSVYVFRDSGGAWSEEAKLTASGATAAEFGKSVSVRNELIAVGDPEDSLAGVRAGSVSIFHRSVSGTWVRSLAPIVARAPSADIGYGRRVRLSQSALVTISSSPPIGAAHTMDPFSGGISYCTAKINSCGSLPTSVPSGCSSANATSGFHISLAQGKAQRAGLLLYTDAGPASIPFQGGILCLNPASLKRSVVVVDTTGTPGLCNGFLTIDMNCFASGNCGGNPLPSLRRVGTRIHCQWWARDTVANGSLLSDALQFVVVP